jgi:amidohydrolase
MIREQVLENPPVVAVFGLHAWPETLGLAGSAPGVFLASADTFRITIKAKAPGADNGLDAVAMAAHVITGLQSLLRQTVGPTEAAQLSIGRIAGGSRADRIAEGVTLEGVLRTVTESTRRRLSKAMESAATDIVESYGGETAFVFDRDTPALYNHPDLFALMRPSFDEALGAKRFWDLKPQMMDDDFARYGQIVPSFFFFLGVRGPRLPGMAPLHSPAFNPDERSIELGMKVMARLIIDCLERQTALNAGGR